jgi:hypothetical protein
LVRCDEVKRVELELENEYGADARVKQLGDVVVAKGIYVRNWLWFSRYALVCCWQSFDAESEICEETGDERFQLHGATFSELEID